MPATVDMTVIEYEDMTDEQKRIVDAGNQIAGTIPSGLTREELADWIEQNFENKEKDNGV